MSCQTTYDLRSQEIRKYGKNLVNVKKCNLGEEISQCPASIAEIKFWQ